MPNHDIIDNRNEKLVDQIRHILPDANRARFAVGYFFLSGLEALEGKLDGLDELRLLIGNTSSRTTVEQIAEGYRRLELVERALDEQRFPKRSQRDQWVAETAGNVRDTAGLMDQTDEAETLVHTLVQMIAEGRLKVRVYTQGRLHSKAYIFDYAHPNPGNQGIAIVGSSNLTLSGLTHNTELNVLVHDKGTPGYPDSGNHARLVQWFEELWAEAEEFAPWLMEELQQSWAARPVRPYDVYMKTLYTLVRDRLEGGEEREILWDDDITRALTDFQKAAVHQAVQMIRDNGGCFVADVVGLGKSYIGAAIVKHFERTEQARPLIICPKPLQEMWSGYNERYHLNAQVLPMSMLQSGERGADLLNDVRYRDRDFVLVDESHNFRHHSSQRYGELQSYLATGGGRKVCLLTATPRANRATDIYNQIKLFHPDDVTLLPIDPPNLRRFFNGVERGEKQLQELLPHVLIRRTRRHILRWYGYAEDTHVPMRELTAEQAAHYLDGDRRAYILVGEQPRFFPRRQLETLRYSIEATYDGLYQDLRGYLGGPESRGLQPGEALTYARYGLWRYVRREKQDVAPYTDLKRAGINLRGLIRIMLFKRFESSVYAFQETLARMITTHEMFLRSLDGGFVPAGERAEDLLGRGNQMEEAELLDALAGVSQRYRLEDFHADVLREHIAADLELLQKMLGLVAPITAEHDDKLQCFMGRIREPDLDGKKLLIFTQYADTADYLYGALDPDDDQPHVDYIYGTDKSKSRVVGRFAPKANPEFAVPPEQEIQILVATDVLAEGLNLQDGNIVINYDLHWNPVRLIQRLGRVDRIGSEHDAILALNFLPETELERNLGLHEVLHRRIQEIHDTIGEDAAILDDSEQINGEAMYAIYVEGDAGEAAGAAQLDDEDVLDLNEAEELFRTLMKEEPEEFERIADLRDGIRSGRPSDAGRLYVFCEAGGYQQLFLVGGDGEIISRDLTRVLPAIRAARDELAPASLPPWYNEAVMEVKRRFSKEVERRQSEQRHTQHLSPAQRYVVRELRVAYAATEEDGRRAQIEELERVYRMSPTVAVRRELNWLRRNGITGEPLVDHLTRVYHEHRLRERAAVLSMQEERAAVPRIVCSEALF